MNLEEEILAVRRVRPDKIYLQVGGEDQCSIMYDPDEKQWTISFAKTIGITPVAYNTFFVKTLVKPF